MYQPTAFQDGENIVIIDSIPHYCCRGATYKDKLKNGLSLDYVFYLEDMVPNISEENVKEVDSDIIEYNSKYVDYENNCEMYEQKELKILGLPRKGKNILFKKHQAKNMKKTMVKINGYKDKLFARNQESPDIEVPASYMYDEYYTSFFDIDIYDWDDSYDYWMDELW